MKTPAPLSVQEAEQRYGWQTKLHRWAERDEQARFGDVFNLVCDPATLLVAWQRGNRNRGSRTAGVDGQTRARLEQMACKVSSTSSVTSSRQAPTVRCRRASG